MEHAGNESKAKDIPKQACFYNDLPNPFWKQFPVRLALPAGDVRDDTPDTLICEIEGKNAYNDKEDLFNKCQHGFSCIRNKQSRPIEGLLRCGGLIDSEVLTKVLGKDTMPLV